MITRVALSGSGWLFPWHIGVLDALRARPGILQDAGLRVTGTSGGALVAVADACGIASEDAMRMSINIAEELQAMTPSSIYGHSRSWPLMWGRMGEAVEQALREHLPADAHELCNNGRVGITVTPLQGPTDKMVWREPEMISHFSSRDDLIQACLVSSHIPYYLDGKLSREWRGRWWVDGGMLDILPSVVDEDNDDSGDSGTDRLGCNIVKSCPYETLKYFGKGLRPRVDRHLIISPGWSEFSLVTQLLPWTFHPAAREDLMALYAAGQRRTEAWLLEAMKSSHTREEK